jgi:hypothetical protein
MEEVDRKDFGAHVSSLDGYSNINIFGCILKIFTV